MRPGYREDVNMRPGYGKEAQHWDERGFEMDYPEFLDFVQQEISKKMGKGTEVCLRHIIKNNGVERDAVIIRTNSVHISPAIYLNAYYQAFRNGETLQEVVDDIIACYKVHIQSDDGFLEDFFHPGTVSRNVVCRLVNTEKNRNRLKEIPHRDFLNLSVIYYYEIALSQNGSGGILIQNQHLKGWGMTPEELDDHARRNTAIRLPHSFCTMNEMMEEILNAKMPEEPDEKENPLYVLTNEERLYGAYWMSENDVLEKIGRRLEEDYYILPSSVHECMIVPCSVPSGPDQLFNMVRDINASQVEPEEFLADAVYRYYLDSSKLIMVR